MNKILKYQGAGKLISLLDDIVKAAKRSPIDFSDWGKLHRSDMLKIPGNESIVSRLSDAELGYLLYNRNGQILNGIGSRHAVFTGSGPMSVKRINIFDSPGRNTGYLIPEYRDVVPGTVSTHYVENLTGGLSKGISEDSYNALMNITGMPLSANRIWKMPEITSKVYAKFKPGVTNPHFKMSQEWLATDLGASTYKPKWWSSGSSWDDELKYLEQRSAIDAGTSEGDELYNVFDDFYEDAVRFPIEKTRPVIQGPTRFIPTKHEFLFQINPQTIKNGTPVVNWFDPNIWLKNGGKIAKYQSAGWIGKGIKWLSTKGDELLKFTKHAKINYSINKGSTRRSINRALKYSIPTSSDGFRLTARPKMLTIQPVNPSKDFGDFYKALEDLSWVNPKFRQFTGYGARPITISEFDDVMSGIQSGIQQNTKFVDDVDQIIRLRTSSPQHSSVENLIKFKKIPSYLGHGAESAVFQGSDLLYVYKTPHGPHLISGVDDSSFIWTDVSGVDIDDMYQKAINFANDFNSKYIYQEPISLIGYRKFTPLSITGDKIGRTSYIPVFKQLRGQVLNEATSIPSTASRYVKMLTNTSAAKKLRPHVLSQKWTEIDPNLGSQMHEMLIDFPKNNLFLENPNLNIMPIDAHFGNWGIFDGKLRGIDLHKNGGIIK